MLTWVTNWWAFRAYELRRAVLTALLAVLIGWGEGSCPAVATMVKEDYSPDVQALFTALQGHGGISVINSTVKALESRKDAVVRELVDILEDEDPRIRYWALRGLDYLRPTQPAAIAALVHTMAEDQPDLRMLATAALGDIGPAAAEAIPALITALQDEYHMVRRDALLALGQMEEAANSLIPHFVEGLSDPHPRVRGIAASMLGRLGPPETAIPILISMLSKDVAIEPSFPQVRNSAIFALGMSGPAAKAALPLLLQLLQDEDASIQTSAAFAVGRIRTPDEAIPALIKLLSKRGPDAPATGAAFALIQVGPKARDAVPGLIELLRDDVHYTRKVAAQALGEIGSSAAIPALARLLAELVFPSNQQDDALRKAVEEALAKIRGK